MLMPGWAFHAQILAAAGIVYAVAFLVGGTGIVMAALNGAAVYLSRHRSQDKPPSDLPG